jgi:hypothetical protein
VVTQFSPRSAATLAQAILAGGWPAGRLVSVAMSAAADAAFAGLAPRRRIVAAEPGRAGMIPALALL